VTNAALQKVAERKLIELHGKLAGIGDEFNRWLGDADSGKPLRKHRSQIERLTYQLRGFAEELDKGINAIATDDAEVLARSRVMQTRMLEVHQLWDYFRSKLSLRYIAWFRDYLATADEYAWACYEPAERARATGAAPRTVPLVFLSGDFSPFTYAKDSKFEVEAVPEAQPSEAFLAYVTKLPIPVIGVPWYQVTHLADAVLIAHEVGHDVEKAFDLTGTIESQLNAALDGIDDPEAKFAWTNWLREIWADVYGALVAGPSFVAALRDILVTDPTEVALDARTPSPFAAHPPAWVRLRVTTHVLEASGFAEEASAEWETWNDAFPAAKVDPTLGEAKAVLENLLTGTFPEFGGKTIGDVVSFSSEQQRTAVAVKGAACAGVKPQASDIRSLVAGARLAFDVDPAGYRQEDQTGKSPQDRILERAIEIIGDAPRVRSDEVTVSPDDDRAAGRALFTSLGANAVG
jgi:hypothetical protein